MNQALTWVTTVRILRQLRHDPRTVALLLEDTAERLRGLYSFRRERFRTRFEPEGDRMIEDRSANYQRLRHELLDAERRAVLELRRSGRIDDKVMRQVVRDLDLEDARLDL
jgi:monovalent cation/hydrogen antiporter